MKRIHLVAVVGVIAVACNNNNKKDEAPKAGTSASPVVQAAAAGDGKSRSSGFHVAMGKPVEGTLRCDGPSWFIVAPGPMDAQIKYELQIPKGAAQHCTHLNARDGSGNVVDATVSLCSDDAAKFSAGQGPFGKDVAYFTIEPNDPAGPCVAARYRLTLLAK